VLAGGEPCGQRVGWVMVWDGGEPGSTKVRQYETFCYYHKLKAAQQAEADADLFDDEGETVDD
jgi:hypothetical protein